MEEENIEKIAEEIAKICFDGNYTLFRFTTNWQFGFGTINPKSLYCGIGGLTPKKINGYGKLYAGKTKEKAMYGAIMDFLKVEMKK